ncbi:threonine/homoserine/homoserine lactone efflux protein [Azorhizobium sp. AG788]|nr:threonine/homoserine/homoserine lactone efflux protein [Azorhizobium sp. AG788]
MRARAHTRGMDFATLSLFAVALAVAAVIPGPAVVALVTRTLARGTRGALTFSAALILGDVLWLAAAVLGLSALAATLGSFFFLVRLAGAAYLLLLAWRLWRDPGHPVDPTQVPQTETRGSLFGAGLALSMGNPKTMAFYLAMLPAMLDLDHLTAVGFAEMAVAIVLVLTGVFAFYVHMANRARHLMTRASAMKLLNRVCGTVLAGTAVAVATK